MSKLKKRPDGRYSMQIYIGRDKDGKRKYKTVYGATQKEAQRKAEKLRVKLGKGVDITADKDTFATWRDRWLIAKKSSTTTAQYNLYETRAKTVCEYIGHMKLTDITTADMQTVINDLSEFNPYTGKPTAKKTLGDYKQIMSQIFQTAIQSRATDYNPAEYIGIPIDAPIEKRRAITDEERLWIESTPHRAQTAAMIMLYAGLRRGEVAALTWNDIDFKAGTITVSKSVTYKGSKPKSIKTPKTEAGSRVVPMPQKLIDYLSNIKRDSLLVVTSAHGDQMTESAWKRLWESYMSVLNEKYGVHPDVESRFDPKGIPMTIEGFTPHCLRHTYCTLLYEAGIDAVVAKELMGHSDIKTTLGIYTHLSHEHTTRNARLLNEYLSNIDGENKADTSQS